MPRPLIIPGVMKIVTLADVRELMEQHLPQHFRAKTTWRYVAAKLKQAAHGADTAEVAVPLAMVLVIEGVEFHRAP